MSALRKILVTTLMTSVVFLLGFVSGCMTIKGLASDLEVGAGAVNRAMKPLEEQRRQAKLDRAAQLVIESRGKVETND